MFRCKLLAVAFSILLIAVAPGVAGAEEGISGSVLNKTGGETPVKSQEVQLKLLKQDGSAERVGDTKTDELGKFSFPNLSVNGPVTYTVTTKFQEVEYQTTVSSTQSAGAVGKADLVVYDSSSSANVEADLSHLVIVVDPTTRDLSVLEIAVVSNPSDKTLVANPNDQSGNGRTLWFPLPKGALHPEVTEGLDKIADSNTIIEGLAYSGLVLPGKRQVVYSYALSYPGSSFAISKPLAYPTKKVNVLMSDVGQTITGPKLSGVQRVNLKDEKYLALSGLTFEAGDNLQISVSNFPGPNGGESGISGSNDLKWVALIFLAAAGGAVVFVYPRIRAAR